MKMKWKCFVKIQDFDPAGIAARNLEECLYYN